MGLKASLLGKLICCDPAKVVERLNLLLTMIIGSLCKIAKDEALQSKRVENVLPLIDIYIRGLHLVATELQNAASINLAIKPDVLFTIFSLLTNKTE